MSELKPQSRSVEEQCMENKTTSPGEECIVLHTDTFEISDAATGKDLPKNYFSNWRFILIVLGSCMGNNSYIMPYIFAANVMPAIEADLGASSSVIWIALAYTLGTAVCLLLFGRLADVFGRRYFVIGGNVLALIGCIIAATAKNIDTIVGGMVFKGLGAGVQQSFTIFLAELIPKKHRVLVNSAVYVSSIAGYGLAPVVARSLMVSTNNDWRWCFYIGVILDGCLVAIFTLAYHPPSFHLLHVHRSRWEQLKRLDIVGIVLFIAGMLLFLMGVSWGGSAYPWKSAHVIATIVVGFLTLVAFVIYEWFYKGDQILPTHLFKAPGFVPMTVCASVGTCVAYSMAIIWPQQVNTLLTGSPQTLGFYTSVQTSCTLLGMFLGGVILSYKIHHKYVLVAACTILTAMCGSMASVHSGQTVRGCTLIAFAGASIGVIETASRSLLPLSCPDEDIGAALGVLGTIGYAAAAIATAIYTTVLRSKLTSFLPPAIEEAALDAGLPKSSLEDLLINYSTNITAVPGITSTIIQDVGIAVQNSSAHAFQYVWYTAIAFGLCAIIASVFIINYGEYYTNQIARKLITGKVRNDASAAENGHPTSAHIDEK